MDGAYLDAKHALDNAFEAGHVVGQPAGVIEKDQAELGNFVACFGCAYVCIFGELPPAANAGGASGAH